MSGIEALAVIGIIANIIAVVDFSVKVYDRAKGFGDEVKDVPEEFREVRRILPLVANTLEKTSSHAKSGQVDEETCKVLRPVLEGCQIKIEELSAIFNNVLPAEGASKWTRGWKAVSSMGQDKKVKALASKIWDDVQALTYYHVSEGATAAQLTNLTTAMATFTASVSSKKTQFILRYQKDEDFIGRDEVMKEIEERSKTMKRVAIAGIGGVGKSRIAIEYCYQLRRSRPDAHVLWVHGGNRARFEAGYADIARALEIPKFDDPEIDVLELTLDWLSDEDNGSWLLVLDNADDSELWIGVTVTDAPPPDAAPKSVPLVNYLPRGSHGFMIITTRDIQLGKQLANVRKKPITVLPFGREEAGQLLRSKLSEDDESSLTDAHEIVDALDHLPLAITQAAAFLDQTEMTVAEYLALLRAGKTDTFDLLKTSIHDPSRDYEIQNSVFQTWKISFDQILKQDLRAAELLSLMAMLDRQAIPMFLLKEDGESDLQLIRTIQKLKAFSLITEETKSLVFSMHRLVQYSVQKWLEHQKSAQKFQEAAISTVSRDCPRAPGHEYWPMWRSMLPHVRAVIAYKAESKACQLHRADILVKIGNYDCEHTRLRNASDEMLEALQIYEKILGPEDVTTLSTASNLAIVLSDRGKYVEAEKIFKHVLAEQERLLGSRCQQTLETMHNLGVVCFRREMIPEAEDFYHKALEGMEITLGPGHSKTLDTVYSVATLYYFQGKLAQAESMYRRVIEGYEEVVGPIGARGLIALHKLGVALHQQGKMNDAEAVYLRALDGNMSSFGAESLSALLTAASLAQLYDAQGRINEAEVMYLQALTGYDHTLGDYDKFSLQVAVKLAKVYDKLGRTTEAEALNKRVDEFAHNPDHGPDIICDSCDRDLQLGERYYHCHICNNANFDLCQMCINDGASCLDETHHLMRRKLHMESILLAESWKQTVNLHGIHLQTQTNVEFSR